MEDEDKVMEEEEEEEEKEHFFADIVTSDRDHDDQEEGDADLDAEGERDVDMTEGEPRAASTGPESSATPAATEQERRAQIGASPYLAPFTPLSSPNRPKTPSSVSASQRSGSKKPQLVPMKNGPAALGGSGSASKVLKDDVVEHLPNELVDSLMSAVQTLDKLILGVEDFNAEQLGFLTEKANAYVDLLKKIDAAGADYNALIPLQVLEMLDGDSNTNPELFTKAQLERCQDESPKEAGKTTIANFLSEQSDRLGGQERYQPTMGVRILELERNKTNIELWDVSGDQVYEACWLAVMKDANGVMLVYNPESHVHESEAMLWYEWFMQNPSLDPAQCLVFEHSGGSSGGNNGKRATKLRLPPALRSVATTFDSPNVFKAEFDKFVYGVHEFVARQPRSRK
ncbi:hypothetical protein Poli38472_005020 [Pythium oligandrum]|uniref:Mediator of RNA polymerase II transcription subunit 10 n=1 Tax=Pythium oligandrum TaxID=41045 RepID=A0A8K1CBK6_PYTOL|nr:hypothetical protein Poli38472_005020 [Pythium oligandrum]|eukprot:TMW59951.1 hypothetical protein Poli38472_005020 [Pythium oligandrum]